MSAVPNLPEDVVRSTTSHLNDGVEHGEHEEMKSNMQTNGTAAEARTNGVDAEPQWQLHDTPVENQRPIRVIVIGAGYSGVYCGIRIPERLRNCELVIYEKNAGIGGTWWASHDKPSGEV